MNQTLRIFPFQSTKDPQKNQQPNAIKNTEWVQRLGIHMDVKRPAEPEEGPSSKRKDTRSLSERNQMLASLLANPSNPPVTTTPVQRKIIPDISSSSINVRGGMQQAQKGVPPNGSGSSSSNSNSNGSSNNNSVNTNNSSSSSTSNLNNNQKQQIVQQMNQGRSNAPHPQQQQQQPPTQQPTGTIRKPSDLYLNQMPMPHEADLKQSQVSRLDAPRYDFIGTANLQLLLTPFSPLGPLIATVKLERQPCSRAFTTQDRSPHRLPPLHRRNLRNSRAPANGTRSYRESSTK